MAGTRTGIFASWGGPDPYLLVLRPALLQGEHYRQCQLVSLPSFAPANVVFIRDERGQATVVSRTVKEPLWSTMIGDVPKRRKDKSADNGVTAQGITIDQIESVVDTRTASIDRATADLVMNVCREVLLRTRYADAPTRGNDGVDYHAGHWIEGTFLAGETWSPKPGTIAREFVDMEDALAAYAKAPSGAARVFKGCVGGQGEASPGACPAAFTPGACQPDLEPDGSASPRLTAPR